jgi:hypothetical protein
MILTSRRQQRALAEMRDALRGSDPRLVAKFTMFTRLTEDEEIPRFERMRASPLGWAVSAIRARRRRTGRSMRRPAWAARLPAAAAGRRRLSAILFVPALVAALLGIVLVLATARPAASCAAAAGRGHQPTRPVASQRFWMVRTCGQGSPGHKSAGGG